ncbi:MAG TPA: TIGR02281 family clan AA aspartic protease [Xanthobacteraceae bacterium]|jgi:aspartyl protease family protein
MLRSLLFVVGVVLAVAYFAPDLASRLMNGEPSAATVRPLSATPESESPASGGTTRIAADRNGHYVSDIQINGRTLNAIVDTGATLVALRYEDARALGIVFPGDRFDVGVRTANGSAQARRVRLRSVRVGAISFNDVDALVMSEGMLGTNLLGMSFLKRLSRYEVRGATLVLER